MSFPESIRADSSGGGGSPAATKRRQVLSIARGQNVGFFFDSDEDHRQVIREFARDGLEQGEKILYLTARRSVAAIQDYFKTLDLPEGLCPRAEQICIVPAQFPPSPLAEPLVDIYRRFLLEQLQLARRQGFSGLRMTSEQLLSIEFLEDPPDRLAYKRQVQALVREQGCVTLCQYDLRFFDSGALLDLLSTHEQVIFGREFHRNLYFVPFDCAQSGRSRITLRACLQNLQAHSHSQQEIQHRVAQQAMVAELGRDALAGMELDDLMAKVVIEISQVLGGDWSRVLELDPAERRLVMRAASGWTPHSGEDRGPSDCLNWTLEGQALLEATRPVVSGDLAQGQPLEFCRPVPEQAVSAACIAIPGHHRPFGVLGVYTRQLRSFAPEDLLFLQSVANILAVAIDRRRTDQEIQQLAYYDRLTGLPNRTLLHDRLDGALSRARRGGHEVAVMFLDLDRFKSINDTLGHASGDELLKIVGQRLIASVRQTDTVARLGGDEFVILLAELDQEGGAADVAQKVLHGLATPVMLGDQEVITTTSIGISIYPEDGEDSGNLLRNADIAMYQAKEQGKNTYRFFSQDLNARVQERVKVETCLRKALERDELFLLYQPQLDLRTGRMVGMEALVRWNHPELGVLTPDKFIGVAEDTGLILNIGQWVITTACKQANAWTAQGFAPLRLAVNISGRQFNHPCFIDQLDHVLESTCFDPARLELELTESTIMENADITIMTLTDVKVRGINLAIDDFGTGYSSLSYLKHFPFDRLKIAQSFVKDVTTDADNAAIVDAVIAVAHSLNIKVIAEGVETRQQLDFLFARQCDELQGFYFGRPIGVDEFTELLRSGFALKDICPFEAKPGSPAPSSS
ncbi:diguanylate cyclase (GGDEF) domain-containing protein [Geoalkalibacter ferrihydriticus]|uniref:Diguanylate cyclase (GGDEF) domain-containing protein n=1 Tax=Geoalkalibacter ferrihydriticus TaxID=392333 RepID=A0A1G9JQ29_9BACT|nr:EAL domain-containing protein [Geoalkalibacter ferrihydriticus]SDL39639.1 diguanylate cyclase (GGDEF) domain-containing protein [Geoalkalibacter ferrihydriticus]